MDNDYLHFREPDSTDLIDVYTGGIVFVILFIVLLYLLLSQGQSVYEEQRLFCGLLFYGFMILFCIWQLDLKNKVPLYSKINALNYKLIKKMNKSVYIFLSGLVYSIVDGLILCVFLWAIGLRFYISFEDILMFLGIYTLLNFIPEGIMNYNRYI